MVRHVLMIGTGARNGRARMGTELGEFRRDQVYLSLLIFFFSGHMNDRAETGVMQERHKGVNEGLVTAVTCQRHVRTAASISDRFPE